MEEKIGELHSKLEAKQGCPLMEELQNMSFENQIKTIKEIEWRTYKTPETTLSFSRNRFKDSQKPEISIANLGDEIFSTSLGLHTARITMSCKDEIRKVVEKPE